MNNNRHDATSSNDLTHFNQKMGKGIMFERIRRITGYLTGSLSTWNSAKKAEERDRVKHGFGRREVKN